MTGNNDDVTQEIESLADEFISKLQQLLDEDGTAFNLFIYDNGWSYEKEQKSDLMSTMMNIASLTKKSDGQEIIETINYLIDCLDIDFEILLYELLEQRVTKIED